MEPTQVTTRVPERPGPRRRWPRLAAAALALAGLAALAGRARAPSPWSPPTLRPAEFIDGIPVPRDDMRLVVSVLELNASAAAESPKRLLGVDLGTTRVSLSVPARVHYALDLSGPEPVAFRLDEQRRALTALFPEPQVQAVEVLAAGKRVTVEPGWARLKALSGAALADGLERGLYDSLKREAAAPRVLRQVKSQARPMLAKLLEGYLRRAGALGPRGLAYARVRFRGEEPPQDRSVVSVHGAWGGEQ